MQTIWEGAWSDAHETMEKSLLFHLLLEATLLTKKRFYFHIRGKKKILLEQNTINNKTQWDVKDAPSLKSRHIWVYWSENDPQATYQADVPSLGFLHIKCELCEDSTSSWGIDRDDFLGQLRSLS